MSSANHGGGGCCERRGGGRLSMDRLREWEELRYGMFIHFGMSTFTGQELPDGNHPSSLYNPDKLNVDQWISTASDAGMKYAVLTTKHVSGHCLWASKHTDYHVGTSGNPSDVLELFVKACRKYNIVPGFYYCSWDNHHRMGSLTPSDTAEIERKNPGRQFSFTTRAYQNFQTAQIREILTGYGEIGEVWIDIPSLLPRCYREELYNLIASLQPAALIMMNTGISDGSSYPVERAWPGDLIAIERFLPPSRTGHVKRREIEGKEYYLPGEVCETIGREWFYVENDCPRPDDELLGIYLVSGARNANLLLNVPPDRHGIIPEYYVEALSRLRTNIDNYNKYAYDGN